MVNNSRNASFCASVHSGAEVSSGSVGAKVSASPVVVLTGLTLAMNVRRCPWGKTSNFPAGMPHVFTAL